MQKYIHHLIIYQSEQVYLKQQQKKRENNNKTYVYITKGKIYNNLLLIISKLTSSMKNLHYELND